MQRHSSGSRTKSSETEPMLSFLDKLEGSMQKK